MYGMVHTMVCILYALNILSRYGNNPGTRHILSLKHLPRYVKYSKQDRLIFKTHDGPYDIDTMTKVLQLKFQMIGWKQDPTVMEEDNQACMYYSKTTHMTRNLRHLSLADANAKGKVKDGTCIIVKVASENNNSDIGTKLVTQPIFTKLTSQIVDRTLRTNL